MTRRQGDCTMRVSELMDPRGILLYANIDNAADALGILVELQEHLGVITNGTAYYNAVCQRETFGGTTAIGRASLCRTPATPVCLRPVWQP